MKYKSLMITEDLHRKIKLEATKTGQTIAVVVDQALRDYLQKVDKIDKFLQ